MKRCIDNLQIWQFSRALVNRIYEITAISKDYGFNDQIQRAAISIMIILQKDMILGLIQSLSII